MEIDDKKIEQLLGKMEAAIATISRMDMWLPKAIDNAVHGHSGTLDYVDIDRIRRDKKEEEKHEAEINSLHSQIEESHRQTQEMKRQTRYLVIGLIITSVSSLAGLIIQIIKTSSGIE